MKKRTLLFLFIVLITLLFAFAYKIIMESSFVYNLNSRFRSLLYGQMFQDTYFENQTYQFRENAEYSKRYLDKALKSILEFLVKELEIDNYYKNFIKNDTFINEPIEENLTENGIILLYGVFDRLQAFCDKSYLYKIDKNTPIMNTIFSKITKDNYIKFINRIWQIDQDFIELSLQKKPDNIAAIQLRIDLNIGTCRKILYQKIWNTALEYLEYKEEKRLYELYKNNFAKEKLNQYTELIPEEALEILSRNQKYLFFLKKSYEYKPSNINSDELKKLWMAYTYTLDNTYLEKYINTLRDYIPFSNSQNIQDSYNKLISISNRNKIDKEEKITFVKYHYTLAILEYYLNKIDLSLNNIKIVLEATNKNDPSFTKEVKRLQYLILLSLES